MSWKRNEHKCAFIKSNTLHKWIFGPLSPNILRRNALNVIPFMHKNIYIVCSVYKSAFIFHIASLNKGVFTVRHLCVVFFIMHVFFDIFTYIFVYLFHFGCHIIHTFIALPCLKRDAKQRKINSHLVCVCFRKVYYLLWIVSTV